MRSGSLNNMALAGTAGGLSTMAMAGAGPLGWAALGVGVLSDLAGTGAERAAGRRKRDYISEQQSMLAGAEQQIGELAGMKTELAEDVYGTGLASAMHQTGQSLYGLTRQGQTLSSKVGFARSGQVDTQMQRGLQAGVTSFGFQKQGLQDVLGQKLMDISEWEGAERGRIQSEESRLRYEMAEAKAQSNKKFLGIFNV